MTNLTTNCPEMTMGLDVSDKYTHLCALDAEGQVEEEGRLRTTEDAIRKRFQCPRARVVLEVGPHSRWLSRLLNELGHEVIVANPRMVRLIHGSTDKDDRLDAERLAKLGRFDPTLLHPVQHRDDEAQVDLEVLRARECLVRTRTRMINHVRGVLKAHGVRLPTCSTPYFAVIAREHLPAELEAPVGPLLDALSEISKAIKRYDMDIDHMAKEERYRTAVESISQPKGVGNLTALAYIFAIGDPARFKNSRAVGSYLGLRPKRSQSGGSDPEMRITKAGDEMVRRLLVSSAHYILGRFGEDCDLRTWGLEKAAGSKRAKRRAIVAVARKLAVLMHRLWTTGEVYDRFRKSPPVEPSEGIVPDEAGFRQETLRSSS